MPESRISRVGVASAEASSVTLPAGHKAGDIILVFAFRDGSTTPPTLPAGFTNINSAGSNASSFRCGWKIATSAADTSGTWTNATGIMVVVYRGPDHIIPFSVSAIQAGATSPSNYGGTNLATIAKMNNQWLVAFQGHVSTDTTTMTTAPTGYGASPIITALGATQDMVAFDTNGPVETGFAFNTVAPGGTAAGWHTLQVAIYPAMQRLNNYQSPRVIGMSVGEKIR